MSSMHKGHRKNELMENIMEAHSTTKRIPRKTPTEQQNMPIPVKETRKETEFVGCCQCNQTISHYNVVRCVMCAELRHSIAKCLELPIADGDVSRLYGFNGSSAFICSRCARHINTYKDTVILRSSLTNGIMNANKISEAKILELEKKLSVERKQWSVERREIIEQRDNAVRRYKKNSVKHRGSEIFDEMREMNIKFIQEIRRAVVPPTVQTRHWGSQTANRNSKKSSSSSSSSNSGTEKDSSSSDEDDTASKKEGENADNIKRPNLRSKVSAPNLSEDSDSGDAGSNERKQGTPQIHRNRPHGSINVPATYIQTTEQATEEYDPLQPQILLWPRSMHKQNAANHFQMDKISATSNSMYLSNEKDCPRTPGNYQQTASYENHTVSSSSNTIQSVNHNITDNDIDQLLSQFDDSNRQNDLRNVVQQLDVLNEASDISIDDWGLPV